MDSRSKALRLRIPLVLALLVCPLLPDVAQAEGKAKIEVVPIIAHIDSVVSIAYSPDGARVLSGSGSEDKTVKLWDVTTGALLRTFEGHSERVMSVAFSPDGTRILSGSDDKTLKLWDAATGQLLRTFQGDSAPIRLVGFSPDGTRLISGGYNEALKLWDAATGQVLRTFQGHTGWVLSAAFSPDGVRLFSGDEYNTVNVWDADTGQLLRTFKGKKWVSAMVFSPDGTRILWGSEGTTVKLSDAATGQLLRTFEGHSARVTAVAYSPDGARVLSGSEDKTVKLWDAATGGLLRTFQERSKEVSILIPGPSSVAFSPDGSRVLSGSEDKTVKLWDAATGQLLRTFEGRSEGITAVVFSHDGTRLLMGRPDTLKMWDPATGTLLRTFEGESGVWSVAFSPDDKRVLTGSWDGTMKLRDAATGGLLRTFEVGPILIQSVAFSPDGARVLSGCSTLLDRGGGLKLWDAATGQLLRTFEGDSHSVNGLAFSPDGTQLLSASDRSLKLWDAATGQLLRTFEGHSAGVTSVAFSPDGSRVLSGSADKTLKLWDAATGQLLRTFEGHSKWISSAAFLTDGARLVSGSGDMTLKLWDAATGQLLRTLQGHSGAVLSIAVSPNGRRVASGSLDTTSRIWDSATGDLLASLVGTKDGESLAIIPDGFFAASAKGAEETISVVRGFEVTTIGQVHQSLFSPDLVREALAGDPDGEVQESAKVINLDKVVDSGPAPTVAIVSPIQGSSSSSDLVTLQARISDRGKGIGRIEWRVNGITAAVAVKPKGTGLDYSLRQELALDPGDNTIEVIAYNASNLLASLPSRTTVQFTGPTDQTKPKLHILAIGINAYVDRGWTPPGQTEPLSFPPLNLAVNDAISFGSDMKRAATGLYDEVRLTTVLNQEATRDNIDAIIDRLASEIRLPDTFILFAAAHGRSEDGRFYLIPQDYDGGVNPTFLAQRAIDQTRLQDWLANRIKAKKVIILLDTCESGALVGGYLRSRTDIPASEAALGRLHEATGRPVLTAAAAGKPAFEGYEGHGVFTWSLLDALRHGDRNGNGTIELSELVAHVQDLVPKLSAKLNGTGRAAVAARGSTGDQQSARFGSSGEDFVLSRRLQ